MKELKLELGKKDWGSIQLTEDQAKYLGINVDIENDPGEIETVGPWGIVRKYRALCVSVEYSGNSFSPQKESITIYGKRTMSNIRCAGYHLEGWTSVKGKKRSSYTGSELFNVNGKLINVAVIGVRLNKSKS